MDTGEPRAVVAERTPIQQASFWIGVVFILVGVAGFVPGVTTDYGEMQFAGPDSNAHLLGIFEVSVLHNIVHLAFGIWGVIGARSFGGSRLFLVGGGLIYAVLWIYGLVIDKDSEANFVPLNAADDWLHLGLAVGMITLGLWLGGTGRRPTTPSL